MSLHFYFENIRYQSPDVLRFWGITTQKTKDELISTTQKEEGATQKEEGATQKDEKKLPKRLNYPRKNESIISFSARKASFSKSFCIFAARLKT